MALTHPILRFFGDFTGFDGMTMTWGWILWLARIIHRFLSRSGVGASRWLATSGSPEQLGWRNRSHAGKECATHAVRVSHRLTPTGTFSVSLHGYGNVRGACEARSRSKEKAMQGHRRRRATQRSPATPISPKGGGGTASILCRSSSTMSQTSRRRCFANSTLSRSPQTSPHL